MIRSLLICTALVASSGAGAVALSALHDATGNRAVRTLAPAPVATVEPRFVIPSFAPAQKTVEEPEVIQVALRDAPVQPELGTRDTLHVAPTVTEALAPPQAEPVAKPKPRTTVAKPKPRATKKPVQAARVVRTETVRTFKQRRKARPVIVAQAPAFSANSGSALQPDYVIGVYR